MALKKQKGKPTERFYYNEHDQNQVNQLYHSRKRKKRKLRLKRVGLVLGVVLIIAFFVSPYSRVQKINISGLTYLSEDSILDLIDVDQNSIHLFVSTKKIKTNLLNSGIVAEVKCSKGLFSEVSLEIKEAIPLAYQENEKDVTLIGQNGLIYTINKDSMQTMEITTRILNFTDQEFLKKFASEYVKVSESIRSLVSDVVYNPIEPYDQELIEFHMIDGKKVYIHDIENLASEMKYYQEILSTKPNACVYDIYGKNVYASDCE